MNLTVSWKTVDTPLPDAGDFTKFKVIAGMPLDSPVIGFAPLDARSLVLDVSSLPPGSYSGTVSLVNDLDNKVAGQPAPFDREFVIPPVGTVPVPSEVTVQL